MEETKDKRPIQISMTKESACLPIKGRNEGVWSLYPCDDVEFEPGEIKEVPFGLSSYMEEKHIAFISVRPNIIAKRIVPFVQPMMIYPGYDKEWMMTCQNVSDKKVVIYKGERFADVVFVQTVTPEFNDDIEEIEHIDSEPHTNYRQYTYNPYMQSATATNVIFTYNTTVTDYHYTNSTSTNSNY